ncbi:hypothetical protein EDD18DRAFT_1107503 [Armillaria luteobubalina]|uniref:Uncharacterized protein n=1 Tax=Armillaria luteobubalina TaxID=153913 RepID=A0AA39UUY8_9AGAR|nr:hypothetical protein EDD18DRAFT_1107503 [Armillaria luteobubalina]
MPPLDVEEIPNGEDYPGGGLMICYKDPKGIVYKDLFFPDDLEAYGRNILSIARNSLTELHGAEAANFLKYKSFDKSTTDCIVAFKPPNPHDRYLYRTFEFSPSLWIRVWDSHIPVAPNEQLEFFWVDIVDVSGHPQAVSTCIKVIAGARPSLASEREGNVIAALDDIGASIIYSMMDGIPSSIASPATCSMSQLQSGKRAGHKRSPVLVGPDQLVKMLDLQCHTDYYLEEHPVRGKVVTVTKEKD